jgi:hypothetical protein
MAITVDWVTGEITVPKADTTLVQASPEIRALDTAQFWLDLKDLEATAEGAPWPDTQVNFPSYTIQGIVYAQAFRIIAPYFVTFEDGQYAVTLDGTNNNILEVATQNQVRLSSSNSAGLQLVFVTFEDGQYAVTLDGTNNNILEVATQNQVRLSSSNSAGLQLVTAGSGITQQDKDDIENQIFARILETGYSFEEVQRLLAAVAAGNIVQDGNGNYQIRDLNNTKDRVDGSEAANGGRTINSVDGT